MSREPVLYIDCVGTAEIVLNEGNNNRCLFQGKFQEANKPNKNKRQYTYEALDRNIRTLQEAVKSRGLFGELDHAADSIIHLANASHLITKLWWEGNVLMGEGEILPTPNGKVLKAIIESGGRIGISSRGVGNGSHNKDGILIIDESYKLITFDAVADPSTYGAYQNKVKKESYQPIEMAKNEPIVENTKIDSELLKTLIGALVTKNKSQVLQKLD